MPAAFAAAALAIFTNVTLSIRAGAVLENWGGVCEKKQGIGWFWTWIAMHGLFGAFFLFGAAMTFLRA